MKKLSVFTDDLIRAALFVWLMEMGKGSIPHPFGCDQNGDLTRKLEWI
jgi:hypothetical protein